MKHRFNPTILREYDIRGIYGDTLTAADAEAVGHSFGSMAREVGAERIVLGFDGRKSSPELEAAVGRGLEAAGLQVLHIGLGPTPMLYFSVYHLDADGGIMVTGSHNPPEHNGFKMMLGRESFFGDQIQALGRRAASGDMLTGRGSSRAVSVQEDYVARLLQERPPVPLEAVWDPGNGSAGGVLQHLLPRLEGRHALINGEVDGTFPSHHPDPTVPENLEQLIAAVRAGGFGLGLAFDGDGDRIGAVDETGEIVWGDQLLAILAEDLLQEDPGATIIADVKSSQALFDHVAALGGNPVMWRTGHSLIKGKMAESGAPLAGEMSGHIFFRHRFYGFDDAIFAALRLLGAIGRSGRSLKQLREALPKLVNTPEIRFPCAEDRKFQVAPEVKARLARAGAEVNDIDGVRVQTGDGWWLLRPSNTQDVLVARCESSSEAGLERLKASLAEQLRASGVDLPADF